MAALTLATRLEARRAWVGASDVAAIMGLSPYANPADVYWAKVAQLDGIESKATERGRYVERSVLDWFEDAIGEPLERDVTVPCPDEPLIVSQLDGRLPDGTPVEAKTAAVDTEWGDEYTDAIPDSYVVQAQAQILCTGADVCHVPALIAGFKSLEFRRYLVRRNEDIVAAIIDEVRDFWARYVEPRLPPTDYVPRLETVKRIRRLPDTIVDLGETAALAWGELEAAKSAAKAADSAKDAAQAAVIAMLGEAEAGRLPDGRLLTYREQASAPSVNHKLLAANWPEAVAACVSRGTHRVLRLSKAAKGR